MSALSGFVPPVGSSYKIISNGGASAPGTFATLPEGASVTVGGKTLRITYQGGDGNDVVLYDPAQIEFDESATNLAENLSSPGGPALVVLGDLTNASASQRTVTLTVIGTSGATNGTDFSVVPFIIPASNYATAMTFPLLTAVDAAGSLALKITNDSIIESNESFTLGFNLGVALTNVGVDPDGDATTRSSVTHTIIDNDTATIELVSSQSVLEDSGTQPVVVRLTTSDGAGGKATLSTGITFRVSDFVTGRSAEATDYNFPSNQFVGFVATQGDGATITVNLTPTSDTILEGDETVILTVDSLSSTLDGHVSFPATPTQAVTIIDNETGTVSFSAATSSANEEIASHPIAVVLTLGPGTTSFGENVVVTVFDPMTGTAEATDYSGPTSVTFTPGNLSKTTIITVVDDTIVEGDETVKLQLTSLTDLDGQVQIDSLAKDHTFTITNTDTTALTVGDSTVNEEAGTISFVVTLSNAVEGGFAVTYGTTNGTTEAADFTGALTGTLNFAGTAGETKTITIAITNDTIVEGDETFTVSLSGVNTTAGTGTPPAANSTIDATDTAVGTIKDNDTATVRFVLPDSKVSEANSAQTIEIQLTVNAMVGGVPVSGGTLQDSLVVTVANDQDQLIGGPNAIASPLTDYTFPATKLVTFAAGATSSSKLITMNITQDTDPEPAEDVHFKLTALNDNQSGQIAIVSNVTHIVTILNDDIRFNIDDVSMAEGNSGTKSFVFTISRTDNTGDVSVHYSTANGSALAGSDYSSASGTINFVDGGALTETVSITVSGDNIVELNENFFVNLSSAVGATIVDGQGVGSIINDDSAVLRIVSDVSHTEGNAGFRVYRFTAELSAPVATSLITGFDVLEGTATFEDGDMVTTDGLIGFSALQTTRFFTVLVVGDDIVEPDEQFKVALSFLQDNGYAVTLADALSGGERLGIIINDDANDPPVVSGPVTLGSILEDSIGITITKSQLLSNSSDVDSSSLSVTGLALSPPTAGTITPNVGSWTFTPALNFNGAITFTYGVSDGNSTVPATATLSVLPVSDLDTVLVDATLNPDSLKPDGTLIVGSSIPGNHFVVATDSADAPRVEIGLRADMRFAGVAPRDPADLPTFDLANPPTFYVSAGKASGTPNDNPSTAADDNWARWNYTLSINADTNPAMTQTGTIGDFQYTFVIKNTTNNTVLANVTLEQALTAAGQAALIPTINAGSLFQDSINFEPSFGNAFDPDEAATYTIEVTARSRVNGSSVLSNKIEVVVNHPPVAVTETLSATEDTPVTFFASQLLGNDTDADGNSLKIRSVASVSGGTVVLNPDNTVSFTPDSNFSGQAKFTYVSTDSKPIDSDSNIITVTIYVAAVNDAPVAVDDTFTTAEDTTLTGGNVLSANPTLADSDVEGSTLTVVRVNGSTALVGVPAATTHGSVTLNSNGLFSYTPAPNYFGLDTFSSTISDGSLSSTAVVNITVTPANDAPVAVNDNATVAEDTAAGVEIDVLSNDRDIDGTLDFTSVIATTPAHGSVSVNSSTGKIKFVSNVDYFGTDTFTYTVKDNSGLVSNVAVVTVTVTPVNDAPVAIDDKFTYTEDIVLNGDVSAANPTTADFDADGDTLTYVALTQPAHGKLALNADGKFSYTPDSNYNGADEFKYRVIDNHGGQAFAVVTLTGTAVNDAPTSTGLSLSFSEDPSSVITILESTLLGGTSDVDGDTLDVDTATFDSPGFTLVGDDIELDTAGYQSLRFKGNHIAKAILTVRDSSGASVLHTVTITITSENDAPKVSLTPFGTQTSLEDTPWSFTVPPTTFSDVDAGDVLQLSATLSDGSPLPSWLVFAPSTGKFAGSPPQDFNGDIFIKLSAADTSNSSVFHKFTLSITPVNDAPIAVGDSASTTENASVSVSVLSNDSDVDGDTLSIKTIGLPVVTGGVSSLGNGTVAIDGTQIKFVPGTGFDSLRAGQEAFIKIPYEAYDGTVVSAATLTITVVGTNDAPVATGESVTTGENSAVSIDVLANDVDVDGALSVVSLGTITKNGAPDAAADIYIKFDGVAKRMKFDPGISFDYLKAGETVDVRVPYTVSDPEGATSIATLTITVNGSNDAPIAVNDSGSLAEDTVAGVTLNLTSNDTDVDGTIVGSSLAVVGVPSHGTVTNNLDGTIKYVPSANYFGTDTFSYTVQDNLGALSNVAFVTITVTPVNDAPIAVPDSVLDAQNAVVNFSVLSNDIDVDGDVLSVPLVNGNPILVGGTVVLANGSLTMAAQGIFNFTPISNFVGIQTFTYTLSDGGPTTSSALVTINVASTNLAPIAKNDNFTGTEDTPIVGNVLSDNGNGADSDPNGDVLTAVLLTQPASGTVSMLADGSFTFTPTLNFNGLTSFTYRLLDGRGGIAVGTVSITLAAVNDAPNVSGGIFTIAENSLGGTVVGSVVVTDVDNPAAGQTFTYSLVGPDAALFQISPAGQITVKTGTTSGQLNFERKPSYTFTVTATDSGTPPLSGSSNITVNLSDAIEAGPTINGIFLNSTAWDPIFSDFLDDGQVNGTLHGAKINGATQTTNLTWIGMNQIVLQFSADVSASVTKDDFELFGVPGVRADLTSGVIPKIDSVSFQGNFVIITLNQSLDASRLQFRAISAGIVDSELNKLDGEWTTNSIAPTSGQGVSGGDYQFLLNILPGDLNNDGVVTIADTALLPLSATPTVAATVRYDVDGNLALNSTDRARVVEREGSKLI